MDITQEPTEELWEDARFYAEEVRVLTGEARVEARRRLSAAEAELRRRGEL